MSSTSSSPPSSTAATAAPSCTTATPGKYGSVPFDACNSFYNYDPAFAPALAFTVLFSLATAAHLGQAIVYKKRFAWVIVFAGTWFIAAFCTRMLGAHAQQNQGLATAAAIIILLAPLWINAFVYMILGRMVHFFLPNQSVYGIRAALLTRYFVLADVVSFLVQATGGVMTAPGASASTIQNGLHIYMGGIGLQQLFICLFIVLCVRLHTSALALERGADGARLRAHPWRRLLWTMYIVLGLITIRIIYRMLEFALGLSPAKNPLPYHEAYVFALDATPMFLALALLSVTHPGMVLVGPDSEFPKLTRAEKKAAKAARKQAKRDAKMVQLPAPAFRRGDSDDSSQLTAMTKGAEVV